MRKFDSDIERLVHAIRDLGVLDSATIECVDIHISNTDVAQAEKYVRQIDTLGIPYVVLEREDQFLIRLITNSEEDDTNHESHIH